jgi:drug/metabolite transporter (DMT)-like permease
LAAGAAFAWLAAALTRLRRSKWQLVLLILGWILFSVAALTQHPEFNAGYFAAVAGMALLAACLWMFVLVVIALVRQRGQPFRPVLRLLLFAPLVFILFLLPYIAWALGLLPLYWLAIAAAAVILIILVFLLR